MIDGLTMFSFLSFVLIVSIASIWVGVFVRDARRRACDLTEVATAMQTHYSALEVILDSDEVSSNLKSAVYSLHCIFVDRVASRRLLQKFPLLADDMTGVVSNPFDKEIQYLKSNFGNVYDALGTVVKSGLFMALVRWPESTRSAKQIVLDLSLDDAKERSVTRILLRPNNSQIRGHGDFNTSGGGCASAA